jgi:hypothetical protein
MVLHQWESGKENTQHPTANIEHPRIGARATIGCWAFDVGCWMFPGFMGREPESASGGTGKMHLSCLPALLHAGYSYNMSGAVPGNFAFLGQYAHRPKSFRLIKSAASTKLDATS